ncbi:hypothetical protein LDENG_00105240 [Lucifuga dentata]|nr:hypothetical protein LDENG_00105240 [Lucifuga dentata]
MGPDTIPKTESSEESSEESPGKILLKAALDSDSNDAWSPSAPKKSKQPKNNISCKHYACSVCGKIFNRPSKLERHKSVHTRKPKILHQCRHCDKSFTQLEKLIRHQNQHKTREHPCPNCGKVFDRPSRLERHKSTHSKKPKVPHQCSYCMKTFSKLSKLVRHERTHTGEKPFTCLVCGKGFSESGCCKTHEKTHEKEPEKPHCCSDCGKRFFKVSELRRHIRSHTGEKPFRCSLYTPSRLVRKLRLARFKYKECCMVECICRVEHPDLDKATVKESWIQTLPLHLKQKIQMILQKIVLEKTL